MDPSKILEESNKGQLNIDIIYIGIMCKAETNINVDCPYR